MARQDLTVGSDTFSMPLNMEDPGYGEDVAAWQKAVTNLISTISGAFDIATTSATILNNQSSAQSVDGLLFSSITTRSFIASYVVYRTTDSSEKRESGTISAVWDGVSAWEYSVEHVGDAGVDLQVATTGQVQYFSDDHTGSSYLAQITFTATSIDI